jgi:nucleoside-diphosphate-sugar epimerase
MKILVTGAAGAIGSRLNMTSLADWDSQFAINATTLVE